MMEKMYAAALQKVASLGAVRIRRLTEYFGTFAVAWQADSAALRDSRILGPKQIERLLAERREIDPESEYERICRFGADILTYRDSSYPTLLAESTNGPAVLMYRGTWPSEERRLAIIGTRKPSPYGQNVCRLFAAELARHGVTVVSGGARGIDSISHRESLEYSAPICVLGCGLDVTYPPENKALFDEISERGVLVSEYALGTRPLGRQFPARNRIISGLSRGVLVIEASRKSGTLITADFALEEGRDVFAVPGSIFSSTSEGTHHLLRQGAIFAATPQDILDEYDWETIREETRVTSERTPEEELVYRCCRLEDSVTVDEIIERSTLPPAKVNYVLLQLEMKGVVKNIGNQRYMAIVEK